MCAYLFGVYYPYAPRPRRGFSRPKMSSSALIRGAQMCRILRHFRAFSTFARLSLTLVVSLLNSNKRMLALTTIIRPPQAGKRRPLRAILLLLAVLTSPMVCCGAIQLLDAFPPTLLPSGINFIVNLFEAGVQVENRTGTTLYLTAITTTYGRPMVISQNVSFRQRDIPVKPVESVVLEYDSADMPLSGIAVCRTDDDCRLLAVDYSDAYYIDSYEALPSLDPSWRAAIQSHPQGNYSSVIFPALSLLPILLISGWWYLGRWDKKQTG